MSAGVFARRPAASLLLLALGALACLSCSEREVSGFSWSAGGRRLAFTQSASAKEGEEGRLGPRLPRNAFFLSEPRKVDGGSSLLVELRSVSSVPVSLKIELFAERDGAATNSWILPLRDPSSRIFLPLDGLTRLAGLGIALEGGQGAEVSQAPGRKAPGSDPGIVVELRALSFVPRFSGFSRSPEALELSADFSLALAQDRLVAGVEAGGFPSGAVVDLAYALPAAPGGFAALAAEAGGPRLRIRSRAKVETLVPLAALGAPSGRIRLELPRGAELARFRILADPPEPLVLDLGLIVGLPGPGKEEDYRLYRWDALPSVLVFDFADYAAQDRYLKRLAFFVEKQGFRGRLARDEEIAPLHGWNAHDYRAEDLAAFFRKARAEAFPLSPEERRLESLLLEAGLLVEGAEGLGPGEGAIISLSQESGPALRRTFAVHEASHALYFADAEYRSMVQERWTSLGAEETWFWKAYLGWMRYDTADAYLMANEFQAYLLQQGLDRADEYFGKILPERLAEAKPALKAEIEAYMAEFKGRFRVHAAALEAWIASRYSLRAGRFGLIDY